MRPRIDPIDQALARLPRGTFPNTQEGRLAYQADRERRGRLIINHHKSQRCTDCKRKYPPYVMQFDHVRGEKRFDIGSRANHLGRLIEEIAKCDVVCANCHSIRTHTRRNE